MATNAEDVVDDDKEVTEEDLRALKYGSADVETSEEEDETEETEEEDEQSSEETGEEDGQTDDQTEAEEKTEAPQFVKQFPNIKGDTPEEYAKNLEIAYQNSTAEFHKLRQTQQSKTEDEQEDNATPPDPVSLYVRQKMDEDIAVAFSDFSKQYTQVNDPTEYEKFTAKVSTLQRLAIAEGRISPPKELYDDAAAALHWEPTDKVGNEDRLGNALKDRAGTPRASGSAKSKGKQSKVTDAMVAWNRAAYPGKSDAEIREELEPYIK